MDIDRHYPADLVTATVHDWQALRCRLIFVFDKAVPDGLADGLHERHGEYSAWLVRRGSATLEADGQVIEVNEGQWLFCFGRHIRQRLSPDIHLLSVRVAHSWADDVLLFTGARPLLTLDPADHPQLEQLATAMIGDIGDIDWLGSDPAPMFQWCTHLDYHHYLQHQIHLLQWTTTVTGILQRRGYDLRVPCGVDPQLADVLNYLDTRPMDAVYPSTELLHRSGLSLGQLNRMCVKAYGVTLYGYWESRRIQQARHMLELPNSSVKRIALSLGFKQLSHFSAWFKRHTGRSPRDYRQVRQR